MGSGDNVFTVVAKNIDVLAMPLVSLVFPLYCSIKAIETKSLADDQQWLTYWVLYSLITLFELTFSKVLECWWACAGWYCHTSMVQHVYQHFIRPFYRNPQVKLWYIPGQKGIFGKPDDDDILTAAEKYVQQNGPEAFKRIIARADREARSRRSSYTIFHNDYEY
ncbi:hypothetical protein CASFOL_011681 [Castilleja foliolosa]|uniref:HVA22-like protein n=2 Tax=Castilleja foliolosa TaxID=1961234 RepID=A0ABD3DXI0_9LAMI